MNTVTPYHTKYEINSVALLLGYNQVFFHPEVLDFLPIYDKKYGSLSSKLQLKGLVKPETASSTRSTWHLSRLNTFVFHFSALFQYIEL